MKTYEKQIENDVTRMLALAMKRWHPLLSNAGVTVDVLMVGEIDDESGEQLRTLKKDGLYVAAIVKVNNAAARALGMADALITVDECTWKSVSEAHQIAILDHELEHLMLAGKGTDLERDEVGRPRLKLRPHDFQVGGFWSVVERHRDFAPEVVAVPVGDGSGAQLAWDFSKVARPKKAAA